MGGLDISIVFEKEPVSAGNHLRGKVTLDAKQEINARELVLTLNGEEVTHVEYTEWREDEGSRTQVTREDKGYRSFLSVQIPVETFSVIQNGKVLPGLYNVPFDIELPEHIPSSLFVHDENSHCKIQYELKVQLRGSGKIWDYKQTKEVQIQGKSLPREPMPFLSEPVEEGVNFCCCLNRGNIVFGAKVLDTHLDKGETCTIHLSIRNNSTLEIQKVGADLFQVTYWEGLQLKPHTQFKKLGSFKFPKLPGTEAQSGGERDIEFDQMKQVFKEIEEGQHSAEISMPMDALASYKGNLIKITHHLHVYVGGGNCVSSPEIEIPILCGEKPSTEATDEEPPSSGDAVTVASSSVNIGGMPTDSDDPDLVFSVFEPKAPSMDTLLSEMKASLADLQLIKEKLKDASWNEVFQKLKPGDIANIVKQVDMDFDQPAIAKMIAEKMEKFSCEHALAAVKSTKQWNRGTMVENLLPHCYDLSSKSQIIKDELSDWEKITTQSAFEKALQ